MTYQRSPFLSTPKHSEDLIFFNFEVFTFKSSTNGCPGLLSVVDILIVFMVVSVSEVDIRIFVDVTAVSNEQVKASTKSWPMAVIAHY
jgi:hypothetical protein